jgi:pimeloyl-ACP methyl ester carboxylesterase
VLLPGLLCDQTIWSAQIDALAQLGAVGVPGYAGARSLDAMAGRVLESAPPRFSLAGHSMGARVALEVVRLAPERVERLALLDTGVHPVQLGEAEKRYALLELGRREGIEALVDAWLPPMVHPARRGDPAVLEPLRAMCIRAGLDSYEAQITALLGRSDQRLILPTIQCPTLVATGREDSWSPVAQHQEIAAAIAGSELVVFEDAGHMAPFETPAPVTAALERWLGITVRGEKN